MTMTTRDDDAISLREYVDFRIASLKTQLDERFASDKRAVETAFESVKNANQIHNESHTREHQSNQVAITKADEALTIRLEQMNEFRAQITSERGTYATKAEIFEAAKRLEELIARNTIDLESVAAKFDLRIKDEERFTSDAKAQMGTLRALMGVLLFALTIAGFIIGMSR